MRESAITCSFYNQQIKTSSTLKLHSTKWQLAFNVTVHPHFIYLSKKTLAPADCKINKTVFEQFPEPTWNMIFLKKVTVFQPEMESERVI